MFKPSTPVSVPFALVKSFGAGINALVREISPVASSFVRNGSHEPLTAPLEQSAFGPLAGNVTGPPMLPVSWWLLFQFGGTPLRLLAHVFGFNAVFWTFHTPAPRN